MLLTPLSNIKKKAHNRHRHRKIKKLSNKTKIHRRSTKVAGMRLK
jgi:hypothetical protein